MKLGAADYIAKLVQPDILLQKIKDALAQAADTPATADASTQTPSIPHKGSHSSSNKNNETKTGHSSNVPRYLEGKSEASKQLYSYVQARRTHTHVGAHSWSKRHGQGICGTAHS